MKQIGEIFQTDYLQALNRIPSNTQRDWHQWLKDHNHDLDAIEVLSQYADALSQAGVDLSNFDLIDAITGHLWHLEAAIEVTLSKQDLDNSTAYLIKVLRSQRRLWKHHRLRAESRLPIYIAADWQPESSLPPPGYFESVKQILQRQRKNF